MNDFRRRPVEQNSDHIEAVDVTGAMKAGHPIAGSFGELALLSPVHGAEWTAVTV